MMQELSLVLDLVMLVAFVTLYGTVTWSLIRYSTREMYRYWAIGWVVYSIGAIMGVILSTSALIITDIFAISGMYIGSTIIQDGTRGKKLNRKRLSIYILGIVLFFSLLIVGLLLSWPFYFVFIPLGLYIAYVCLHSAKTVYEMQEPMGQPKLWLLVGQTTWGASWLLFPIMAPIPDYYLLFMVIQAIGVVVAGASMLTLFMMTVTRDLERQYKVTQIMSSLVQHDIRNYIQVARLALDLTENTGVVNDHWIDVASDSLEGAKGFVDEMRNIAISLTQAQIKSKPEKLLELVISVTERVMTEYAIEQDQINVQISEDTTVEVCPLAKELLWNIFDNAFKHESDILLVKETYVGNPRVILEISDRGGGLADDIKDFLNNPNSLSEDIPSGMGLGIVLIQGLATMCISNLRVQDFVEDSKVVGTTYILNFRVSQ
ncbi:MAG: HAMP domain-containing sensor histidine kinase [Candidatus Thorarchaeota archaeon]